MKTCGVVKNLQNRFLEAAESHTPYPTPQTWSRHDSIQRCHYAAMHMLFLGHVKSNINMIFTWLKKYEIRARSGSKPTNFFPLYQNSDSGDSVLMCCLKRLKALEHG